MNLSEINFNKKQIIGFVFVIFFLILFIFWFYKFYDNSLKKEAETIKNIYSSWVNYNSCKKALELKKYNKNNKYLTEKVKNIFKNFKKSCISKFDLSLKNINESFCNEILMINDRNDLVWKYFWLENFEEIQKKCEDRYLSLKFSTWTFFDINDDFKSTIRVELSKRLYSTNSFSKEKQKKELINAKKRLLKYIKISPWVKISVDDVIFYNEFAILHLYLKPKTRYEISQISNWKKENNKLVFTTPEKKYLGLKIENPVSLYMDKIPPRFKVLSYNSWLQFIFVKICRVDNEHFAKLDVLRARKKLLEKEKDFLINWIDNFKSFECKTKKIILEDKKDKLIKKEFNFDKEIWNPARSGLYFVVFENPKERFFNNKIHKPILFGIVDAHITMKLSRNWEAFFFVNDFYWNPLANQKIRLYLNNFNSKKEYYNRKTGKWEYKYFSPLDKNVFSKPIILWKTDKNWVLKVNLKWKVDDFFGRTFEDKWYYDYYWIDNSFFVTAASNTNLTYLKSTWNSWIAPYNFWYKISQNYWDDSKKWDIPTLNSYWETEPSFYAYLNTDRKLYLPWEKVYFKAVLRGSNKLSIPKNKLFNVIIKDPKNSVIYNKNLKVNDFWSIFDSIDLWKNAKLWYYKIFVKDIKNNEDLAYETFAVEVFKKPKFKIDIWLETSWLKNWIVKIDKVKKEEYSYRTSETYLWKFNIKAIVKAKYYNWANLSNAKLTYKVYKEPYYEDDFWDDCYYWCFWEPEKEFYTSWEAKLNSSWEAVLNIWVDFSSDYSDYKYIVEVTIKDSIWDEISSSNSLIVKLPDEYKKYNPKSSLKLSTPKKFYKSWEDIKVIWKINWAKWNKYFDSKYLLLIKKKTYSSKKVNSVRWYKRTIVTPKETLVKILPINSKNFTLTKSWNLVLKYKLQDPWEYVFEYSKINNNFKILDKSLDDLVEAFNSWKDRLEVKIEREDYFNNWEIDRLLRENPNLKKEDLINWLTCKNIEYLKWWWKKEETLKWYSCLYRDAKIVYKKLLKADDLLDNDSLDYFTILVYSDNKNASNPTIDDNKLYVFAEKNSYHIWEKARVLIRLPVSKWKILWTIEKQWVIKKELIDVKSNTFFKEFVVDDSFVPNAYIWVELIPEFDNKNIPEYKVGYTEIVVDKTDKKAFVDIKTDKKVYSPREKVNLDISVKDKKWNPIKSELQVMVVDDALVSLMWNINLDILKEFYKKLPFQIQTSITNIAMLRNYYFARLGVVGWSWYWNFKWWDSAVSSRNIFKNTPFYKANVITDDSWKAKLSFNLPDNLTNFRIIVVSNSKSNFFWVAQKNISVRKNVLVEPKVPQFLRVWDKLKIWVNIFNNTSKNIWFKVLFKADWLDIKESEKNIEIPSNSSKIIYFDVKNKKTSWNIKYSFSILGDNPKNSDKIEWNIEVKKSPVLIQYKNKNLVLNSNDLKEINFDIWKNIDLKNSKIILNFSNTRLIWLKKILHSLLEYPYWCVEQTTSTTIPNVILKRFKNIFNNLWLSDKKINENIKAWIERLKKMQVKDGWFAYWIWEENSNLEITPYVVRSLIYAKKSWVSGLDNMIDKWIRYLEANKNTKDLDIKSEIYWTLAYAWKNYDLNLEANSLSRHSLIAYTYYLVLAKKDKNLIEKNIDLIKNKLNDDNYSWYWNKYSDKAIFTQLLIDYDYKKYFKLIDKLIVELYDIDWGSYYYSTQSKNNTFMAFAKYLKKVNKYWNINFVYSIWNIKSKNFLNNYSKIKTFEYNLGDIVENNKVNLKIRKLSWNNLYLNATLKLYPKDVTKIKAYSNNIQVKREIYEILDEKKLDKCNEAIASYYNIDKKVEDLEECKWVFKKKIDNIFNIWKKYRVIDTIKTNKEDLRNIVLEDYLASSFVVFNNKFKTTSVSMKQNTRNWYFDYVELNKNVIFANASYVWGNKTTYTYYFTPWFSWEFLLPPVTAYEMYNPTNRANSEFKKIIVK